MKLVSRNYKYIRLCECAVYSYENVNLGNDKACVVFSHTCDFWLYEFYYSFVPRVRYSASEHGTCGTLTQQSCMLILFARMHSIWTWNMHIHRTFLLITSALFCLHEVEPPTMVRFILFVIMSTKNSFLLVTVVSYVVSLNSCSLYGSYS